MAGGKQEADAEFANRPERSWTQKIWDTHAPLLLPRPHSYANIQPLPRYRRAECICRARAGTRAFRRFSARRKAPGSSHAPAPRAATLRQAPRAIAQNTPGSAPRTDRARLPKPTHPPGTPGGRIENRPRRREACFPGRDAGRPPSPAAKRRLPQTRLRFPSAPPPPFLPSRRGRNDKGCFSQGRCAGRLRQGLRLRNHARGRFRPVWEEHPPARPPRAARLEPKLREPGVVCGARPRRPMKLPLRRADGHIVDAGLAPSHQAVGIELPHLVAVRAEPIAGIVMPFVLEANGDAVLMKRP